MATSAGALHDPRGLDVHELAALAAEWGDDAVHHYRGHRVLPLGSELTVACDVLVPAARQDVIDARTKNRKERQEIVRLAREKQLEEQNARLDKAAGAGPLTIDAVRNILSGAG